MLRNRLVKRQRHLRKWARRRGVTCYRLYEKDIPDEPLIVDWYDGDVVVWLYDRTRDDTPEAAAAWRHRALTDVIAALEREPDQVFAKDRGRQRGLSQYERVAAEGAVKVVEEGGLRFEVNLSDYLDTGLFLDHRTTRARVGEWSAGTDVLNLFAYTGSFSCYAAAGGARSTVTVDLSRTYCDWALRNLRLNGFDEGPAHRVVQADCLRFLDDAVRGPERFDLIVLDPPTFSNSKRMQETFSVKRHAPFLLARCHALLRPGGRLVFSTNDRGFRLPDDDVPPFAITDVSATSVPDDFRNRRIHQCWEMIRPHE